jgi:hypothetical protein
VFLHQVRLSTICKIEMVLWILLVIWGLECNYAYIWNGQFSHVGKLRLKPLQESPIRGKFDLHQYFTQHFIDPISKSSGVHYNIIYESNSIASQVASGVDIVCLLDLSVRTTAQLNFATDKHQLSSLFAAFQRKENTQTGINYASDKFLYSYDVGINCVQRMSIARIPVLPYQQLDLARRIVELHSNTNITILMIDGDGEIHRDDSMSQAMLSAYQVNAFPMPSLKHSIQRTKAYNICFVSIPPKVQAMEEPVAASSLEEVMLAASRANYGSFGSSSGGEEEEEEKRDRPLEEVLKVITCVNRGIPHLTSPGRSSPLFSSSSSSLLCSR